MRRRSGIDKILSAAIPSQPSHPSHPSQPIPTMLDGTLADNNVDAVDAGLGKVVRASNFRHSVSARALERAIKIVGKVALARKLGVAYQSVDKWIIRGMPKSEWDGRTTYCKIIEEATDGEITRDMLMSLHK